LSFSEANDEKELRILDFAQGRLVQQNGLRIPLPRRLMQVRTQRSALEAALKVFSPPESELAAWVEVIVEDPVPGEDLYETVQALVKQRNFEVIRVSGVRTKSLDGLGADAETTPEAIEFLLSDPAKVFALRVEAESAYSLEARGALKAAFAELTSLHLEQRREGQNSASVANANGVEA